MSRFCVICASHSPYEFCRNLIVLFRELIAFASLHGYTTELHGYTAYTTENVAAIQSKWVFRVSYDHEHQSVV